MQSGCLAGNPLQPDKSLRRTSAVMLDPYELINSKREMLVAEAERERLIAQLPRRGATSRRALAIACHRLANWLDDSIQERYLSPSEPGPVAWVAGSVRM